jgi:hypothetical protein
MASLVESIANEKVVETMVDNMAVPELYRDDLVQEIYLILLMYNQERLQEIQDKGDMRFFISKLITNNYNSKTSRFYYKYKKYNKEKDDNGRSPDGFESDDDGV